MNELPEIYRRIEYLRNKGVKMKEIADHTNMAASVLSSLYSSVLPTYIGCIKKGNNEEELKQIVKRSSGVLDVNIDDSATEIIAKRSRKTPRIANRLLKRVADFALVEGNGVITDDVTLKALKRLGVDETGLDKVDLEYLSSIIIKFNGGPVGIDSIASTIGEESTNIEDVIEPFLLQEGYLKRTARGRIATEKAYDVLDIKRENTLF